MSHHLKTISMNAERDKNMDEMLNCISAITITRSEYHKFVRQSEQIEVVKRMIETDQYISKEMLAVIFDCDEEEKEEGANDGN